MVKVSPNRGSPNLQYLDIGVVGQKGWETMAYMFSSLIKQAHSTIPNHLDPKIELLQLQFDNAYGNCKMGRPQHRKGILYVPPIHQVSDGMKHAMFHQMMNVIHRVVEAHVGP